MFEKKIAEVEEQIRDKDYGNAMTALLDIIDKDPKFALAYNNLGIIAWEESRWVDAFVLFKEAMNLDNSSEDFATNLLDAALKLHKIDEVKAIFEKAAFDNPKSTNITGINKAINDSENDIYKSMRALTIGYWHPLLEEADKLLQEGEYMAAAAVYIEHADNIGICAEVYNGLGIVQFGNQEYEEAVSLFFEALKLNPLNTDTFLNLFDAAKECGQEEDALKIYETLVKDYPELEDIRKDAEELKKK
jgi:tetratricopeptide (TPR) repeat protein